MPPKKSVAKEHNVYLITVINFGEDDEIGRLEILQAHATLDEANKYAEAKTDELCDAVNIKSPQIGYTKDSNFQIHAELPTGAFTVEVVTQPILGGTITPNKAPAKPKKKATPKKKTKTKHESEDDDDEMEDDVDEEPQASTKSSKTSNGKKRKADTPADGEDGDEEDISETDIHAAPSGASNCLEGESFLITGTLDSWTRDEMHALIETFGGTFEKTAKTSLSYVVVGTHPGNEKLKDIRAKGLKTISQTGLYQLIRESPGGESISSEEVAKACKKAKGKTTAVKNAKKAAKEAAQDIDEVDDD